jgi:hypothetical protein
MPACLSAHDRAMAWTKGDAPAWSTSTSTSPPPAATATATGRYPASGGLLKRSARGQSRPRPLGGGASPKTYSMRWLQMAR